MTEQNLVKIVDVSELILEDIKNCYDPAKAGFDVQAYLSMPKEQKEKVYWEQDARFFRSPFNGGTIESFLKKLKYDPRFTEGSRLLLFTDGAFHSEFRGGFIEMYKDIHRRIQATGKMWFGEHLRGYGFEHYLDGISGYGPPYSTRIDLK